MTTQHTAHNSKPGHEIAERISALAYALEGVLPVTDEDTARGLTSAWALAGSLHYYADNPDLAPLPFAEMQLDGLVVVARLEALARHFKAVVRR